jgi:CRP-like cAMP-binding protein
LAELSVIAREVSFLSGELIFTEGDPAQELYLLLDGWVDIVIVTNDQGQPYQLVTTLTPGEMLGWSAVVAPHIYTTSAICASPVWAISFDQIDLQSLFETNKKLRYTMMVRICQVIAGRLKATRLQMASLFVLN